MRLLLGLLASLSEYWMIPCYALGRLLLLLLLMLLLMLCGLRLLRLLRIQSFDVVPVVCWKGVVPYRGMRIITLLG
jgi:hypothetical protein